MGITGAHFVRVPSGVAPETRATTSSSRAFRGFRAACRSRDGDTRGNAQAQGEASARLGDILSLLYLCSATLKRFEDEGRQHGDAPLMHWAIWDAMFKAQNAFEGVISNFPNRLSRR
jgi:acyl-CoA dehydrogenase